MNLFEMMGIEVESKEEKETKEAKKATSGAKKASANTTEYKPKVEIRSAYKLPIKVYYIEEYELTAEDFGGLEEVTEEQIIGRLRDHYDLFMFDEKRVIFDYMEERNTLVAILKSPRKGGIGRADVAGECSWIFESDYISFSGGATHDTGNCKERAFDKPFLSLNFGKIPLNIFGEILSVFKQNLPYEYLAQIFIDKNSGKYFVAFPKQRVSRISVDRDHGYLYYNNNTNMPLVCEIHSHNYMLPLFFSETDNANEVHFKIYGVVGFEPTASKAYSEFRIGTNGTFRTIRFEDVFGGC